MAFGNFVTFTCSGTLFATKLADNAVANGWVRSEAGYDWIKPVESNNVCLGRITQLGAIRIYTEIGVTGQLYTIYEPAVRESYDSGTHTGIGLGWIGWGNPIYWAMRGENDSLMEKNISVEKVPKVEPEEEKEIKVEKSIKPLKKKKEKIAYIVRL